MLFAVLLIGFFVPMGLYDILKALIAIKETLEKINDKLKYIR